MTTAVVVAFIAAAPPTVGVVLTYLQARAARRVDSVERKAGVEQTVAVLGAAIGRLQTTTDRIEGGVADLRERVGRLEGAADTARRRLRA